MAVGIGINNKHWLVAAVTSRFHKQYIKVTDNRVHYLSKSVPVWNSFRNRNGKLQKCAY
jgi:hypothetical protein